MIANDRKEKEEKRGTPFTVCRIFNNAITVP